MEVLPAALAPLGALRQFVCWFAWPSSNDKLDKFPCSALTGELVNAQDGNNWTDAATALAQAPLWDRGHGSGAGFVFTPADDYFFLDIDSCLEPGEPPQWSDLAQQLIARLPGAAVEVSQSGKGLHIFGRGRIPDHAKRNKALGLELYTEGRFVALTGTHAQGNIDTDCTASIGLIAAQYFVPSASGTAADWTCEPVAEWGGPADDDELIAKALRSGQRSAAAAFGGGDVMSFKALWEADEAALSKRWPTGRSEADQTLANHLAFWTGKDCERMERLMRRSALVRPKWDTHRSYLGRTILAACGFVQRVATAVAEAEPVTVAPPEPEALQAAAVTSGRTLRAGAEYMGPIDQLAHFRDCYFLADQARIFDLRRGSIMQKNVFDVVYGGHLFVLDPLGAKTTASAWDAFTLSRVNNPVIVDGLCFRPERPSGAVIASGAQQLVNTWVPFTCETAEGDAGPYLDLLRRQFPIERDRRIFLSYIAHCAQRPGVKSQWWPVLQGTKGNGKSAHVAVLTHIAGEHYTHLPNSHAIARDGLKFNSWVERKTFIGIEEISLQNKRDFLDEFKVIVTADRIPLEGKGANQTTGDNRVNGILCTNFKDGVPVDADERRYAVLWMAQQREGDLERDGMGGDYFPRWWAWFRAGGAAIIAGYLSRYAIEAEFDPAGLAHRAPKTSSTLDAVEASRGRAEQEIQNAVAEGRPGFAGGWVSSFYLDQLLDRIRAPVPRNRRREMMAALGYDTHPSLADGRVNAPVMPDSTKPVLYLRAGHLALNLHIAADIARAYSKAQEPGADDATPAAVVKAFG